MDDDEKKWVELTARFAQSELTGEPSHEELVVEAEALYRAGNRFAAKAVADATAPGHSGSMRNPIYDRAAVYRMYSVETPGQNVPAGQDESGLWRTK